MRICLFFSTEFPYETTLQNELPLLANRFDEVHYFPTAFTGKENGLTQLPENVKLSSLLADHVLSPKKAPIRMHLKAIRIFLREAKESGNLKTYRKYFKSYYSILIRNLHWSELLEKHLEPYVANEVVGYDYWFENATVALATLRAKQKISIAISRAHRFDLYDDAWGEDGQVPFRNYKLDHLDAVYTVATHGMSYLKERASLKNRSKVRLAYLGIEKQSTRSPEPKEGEVLIVSVSNTRDFKRVHLIPEVLAQLNRKVKWVHFGSGPLDEEVRSAINCLPEHVTAEFKGFVPNKEVLEFLGREPVNVFLSLSLSEGLPISMMESLSFGIPVFACNVCGIPDLMTEETGSLFEPSDSLNTIAEKLEKQLSKHIDRQKIHEFAGVRFDYTANFNAFIEEVLG